MSDLATLQAQAKAVGYTLTKLKSGSYVGSALGVEFEDDDFDRLDADMRAVIALNSDDRCTLLDESDEDGESIVEVTLDGERVQFVNISVAEAYAEACNAIAANEAARAKIAAQEPKVARGRRKIAITEDEAPVRTEAAPEPAVEGQAVLPLPEPVASASADVVPTREPDEILPPVGGEPLNALRIDLRAFQAAVNELASTAAKLAGLVNEAVDGARPLYAEGEAGEAPKRGRGRPRKNGS